MSLDFATLDLLRQSHPAWRLLRSDYASLVASFLHRLFVVPNLRVLAQADLAEALEDELFALREQLGAEAFPKPALDYLNDWAANDKGWLRKFYPQGSDEPHYDLTPATEKAIAWLGTLAERPFVGTESRLLTLFDLLKQISTGSQVNPRTLDASRALLPMGTDQDLTLNTDAYARLESAVKRVFITENETNFLAFPEVADAMVVFGAGYGFEMLANTAWLRECEIHYWGDIDTHGFAILDQLRARFPDAQSLLMDRETLMAHQSFWTREPSPERRDLARLTSAEGALYDDLRDNRLGAGVRLEQERIAFGGLHSALRRLQEP